MTPWPATKSISLHVGVSLYEKNWEVHIRIPSNIMSQLHDSCYTHTIAEGTETSALTTIELKPSHRAVVNLHHPKKKKNTESKAAAPTDPRTKPAAPAAPAEPAAPADHSRVIIAPAELASNTSAP